MDDVSAFKRRRLEAVREDSLAASAVAASVGNRTAALEAELRLLRAENARLYQERQQQQPSALDRFAAMRSAAAAQGPAAFGFSSALAQHRLSQLTRNPTAPSATQGLNSLSRDQLLSLLGNARVGASSATPLPLPTVVTNRTASILGATSLPGLPAGVGHTTSCSSSATGLLGQAAQAFQQRLQQVQQQQQHQKKHPLHGAPMPATASSSEEMQERLQRLQQLSSLQTSSTTRPTFNASALPTRLNNNNLSTLDSLVQSQISAPTKKLEIPMVDTTHTTATITIAETTCDGTNATNQASSGRKRKPQLLYMNCDDEDLSQYQTQVRKQIEVFEADAEDTSTSARGRNRPIVAGQVGIRCKHCKIVPPQQRQRGAIYYPSKLDRLYQMSQTIASVHLAEYCQHIPGRVRGDLARLRESKSAALGGKKYWADAGRVMGLVEIDKRLFFADSEEAKEAKKLAECTPKTKTAAVEGGEGERPGRLERSKSQPAASQ